MVMKTRRKRSAAKRVKTAKRRKNNTRSKRGHGRAHGRSAKRGGMNPAARVAARSAAAAAKHAQRIHTLYGVKPKTFSEQFIDKEKETTRNPVEMAITGKGVGDNMEKSAYNERRRELFKNQTPARPHNPVYFSTPKRGSTLHDIHNHTPSGRPTIYLTPAGPSSYLSSPPPPRDDLSIRGNRLPYTPMDFAADMAARNPIQKLDFGDEFKTPESSPYRNSASSLRKTFKTKPGEHRSDTASSPPPTPPRFRI
jgi:hypothetical protein